jgi:hypothetical protein
MSIKQASREQFTLAKPIIQGGKERKAGEQVPLTPHQAQALRASGHIATGAAGGRKKED